MKARVGGRAASARRAAALAGAAFALAGTGLACAQTNVSPDDLNDCTKLTDPAKLQQCVTQGQGGRRIRGHLTQTPKPADAPIYRDSESPAKIPPGAP